MRIVGAGRRWPLDWGKKTYLMGIVNVTPDSFSGDGLAGRPEAAVERALALEAAGADILDVGGESTRPGHVLVPEQEEIRRVLPIVDRIATEVGIPVSIDTRKATVAEAALDAGALIVNDVSGLRDAAMALVVAEHRAGIVVVDSGSIPSEVTQPILTIMRSLEVKVERLLSCGVPRSQIAVDPGLGFGKDWRRNLEIIHDLRRLRSLGLPVVVGPSNKATISSVLGVPWNERREGTLALVTVCAAYGADVIRVHDVAGMSRAARMIDALARSQL